MFSNADILKAETPNPPTRDITMNRRKLGTSRRTKGKQLVKDPETQPDVESKEDIEDGERNYKPPETHKPAAKQPKMQEEVGQESERGMAAPQTAFLVSAITADNSEDKTGMFCPNEVKLGLGSRDVNMPPFKEETKLELKESENTESKRVNENPHDCLPETNSLSALDQQMISKQPDFNLYSVAESKSSVLDDSGLLRQDGCLQENLSEGDSHVNASIVPLITADNALRENIEINNIKQEPILLPKEGKPLITPEIRDTWHSKEVKENVYDQNKLAHIEGEDQIDDSAKNLHVKENYESDFENQVLESDGKQSMFLGEIIAVKHVLTTTGETTLGQQLDHSGDLVEEKQTGESSHIVEVLFETEKNNLSAQTHLSDLDASTELQLQDSSPTTDEHTMVDFNFRAMKRKMGSNRRNKGRQFVKESKEDILGNTQTNESLETRTVLSELKEMGQEEVSQDIADDTILPLSHGSSVSPHDISSKYTEADSQSLILKDEAPKIDQVETNSEIFTEVVENSDITQNKTYPSDTLNTEDTLNDLSGDVQWKPQDFEDNTTQMQEILQIQCPSQTVPGDITENLENISLNLTDQVEMNEFAGKIMDNFTTKQEEQQMVESISEYRQRVQRINESYDVYDAKDLPICDLKRPNFASSQVHDLKKEVDDIKPTTDQIFHEEQKGLFYETEKKRPVLSDFQPQEASGSVEGQSGKDFYSSVNRGKLGSNHKGRERQQDKDSKEEVEEKTIDEKNTQITLDTKLFDHKELRLDMEQQVLSPVSHHSSILSIPAPDPSLEIESVDILEGQGKSEADINLDLLGKSWAETSEAHFDTVQSKSGVLQTKEVVSPHSGEEHKVQRQVEEPQQMDYTVNNQVGEGGVLVEDTKSNLTNPQLQDNSLSTDKQTEAGFSISDARRKLGSSRKKKDRRGKESTEEALKNTRGNETFDRPSVLLQEELSEDNEPKIIVSLSNRNCLFPNSALDLSLKEQISVPAKYPETDLQRLILKSENIQEDQNESLTDTMDVSHQEVEKFEALSIKHTRDPVTEDPPTEVGEVKVYPTNVEETLLAELLVNKCEIPQSQEDIGPRSENSDDAVKDANEYEDALSDIEGRLESDYTSEIVPRGVPKDQETVVGDLIDTAEIISSIHTELTVKSVSDTKLELLAAKDQQNLCSKTFNQDHQPQETSEIMDTQINTDFPNSACRRKLGSSRKNKAKRQSKNSEDEAKEKTCLDEIFETTQISVEAKTVSQEGQRQGLGKDMTLLVSCDSSVNSPDDSSEVQSSIQEKYRETDLHSLIQGTVNLSGNQNESGTGNEKLSHKSEKDFPSDKSDFLQRKDETVKEDMDPDYPDNAENQTYEPKDPSTDIKDSVQMNDISEIVRHDVSKNPEAVLGNIIDQAEIISSMQSELTVKSFDGSDTKQDFLLADHQQNLCSTAEENVEILDQTSKDERLDDSKKTLISSLVEVNNTLGQTEEGGSLVEDSKHNSTDPKLQGSSLSTDEPTDLNLCFLVETTQESEQINKGRESVKESRQETLENTKGDDILKPPTLSGTRRAQQEYLSEDIEHKIILTLSQDLSSIPSQLPSSEDLSFVLKKDPDTDLHLITPKNEHFESKGEGKPETEVELLNNSKDSLQQELDQSDTIHSKDTRGIELWDAPTEVENVEMHLIQMQGTLQTEGYSETVQSHVSKNEELIPENLSGQAEMSELTVKATDDSATKEAVCHRMENYSETLDVKNENPGLHDITKLQINTDQIFHPNMEGLCETEATNALSNFQKDVVSFDSQLQESSQSADKQPNTGFYNSGNRQTQGSSQRSNGRHNDSKEDFREINRGTESLKTTQMSSQTKIKCEELKQDLLSPENSGDKTATDLHALIQEKRSEDQDESQTGNVKLSWEPEDHFFGKPDFLESTYILQNKVKGSEPSDNDELGDQPTDIQEGLQMDYASENVSHDLKKYPEPPLLDLISEADISSIQSDLTVKRSDGSDNTQEPLTAEHQENLASTTEQNVDALDQKNKAGYLYDSKETWKTVGVDPTDGQVEEGGDHVEYIDHSYVGLHPQKPEDISKGYSDTVQTKSWSLQTKEVIVPYPDDDVRQSEEQKVQQIQVEESQQIDNTEYNQVGESGAFVEDMKNNPINSQLQDNSLSNIKQTESGFSVVEKRRKLGSRRKNKAREQDEQFTEEALESTRGDKTWERSPMSFETRTVKQEELREDTKKDTIFSVSHDNSVSLNFPIISFDDQGSVPTSHLEQDRQSLSLKRENLPNPDVRKLEDMAEEGEKSADFQINRSDVYNIEDTKNAVSENVNAMHEELHSEQIQHSLQAYPCKTLTTDGTGNSEIIPRTLTSQAEVSELNRNSIDDITTKEEAYPVEEFNSDILGTKNEATVQHDARPNTNQIFHQNKERDFCEMERNKFDLSDVHSESSLLTSQPQESSVGVGEQTKGNIYTGGSRRKMGSSRRNKDRGKSKDSEFEPYKQPIKEARVTANVNELCEKTKTQDQEDSMGIVLEEGEKDFSQTEDINTGSYSSTADMQLSPTVDQEVVDMPSCTHLTGRGLPQPNSRDQDENRELCIQNGNAQENNLSEPHANHSTTKMHTNKISEHTEPESEEGFKKVAEQKNKSAKNPGMIEITKREKHEMLQPDENLQRKDLCEPSERTRENKSNMYHAQVEYNVEQSAVSSPQETFPTDGEDNRPVILSRAADTHDLVGFVSKEQKEHIKTEQMQEKHQIALPNDKSPRQTLQSDKEVALESQPKENDQSLIDDTHLGLKVSGNMRKMGSSRRNKGTKHGPVTDPNQENKDDTLENTENDETKQMLAAGIAGREELDNFIHAIYRSSVTEKQLEDYTVSSDDVLEDSTISTSDFNPNSTKHSLKSNAETNEKDEDSIQLTGHDTNKTGLMQSAQTSVWKGDSDMQSILFHDGVINPRPESVRVIDQEEDLQRQSREALSYEKDPLGAKVCLQQTNKEIQTVGFVTTQDCSTEVKSSMDVKDPEQEEVGEKSFYAAQQKNTSNEFIYASQEPAVDPSDGETSTTINVPESQGEKTEATSKQKKRKFGSSRRTPMNRKQDGEAHKEDESEESNCNAKPYMTNPVEMEVVEVRLNVLQGEDLLPQQNNVAEETSKTQTMDELQRNNMSLILPSEQQPKPDVFTSTETRTTSEVAERNSALLNQPVCSNSGTPVGSLELFCGPLQNMQRDEHSPENTEVRQVQEVHQQMPSSMTEGIHTQNPGTNASPDLTQTNRRKMGSTRKNLGTRTKQEILEVENDSTDTVTSSRDAKVASGSEKKETELQLHPEHPDENVHQEKEKQTVEISQFGESLLRALAEEKAKESSASPSSPPSSESASRGRRKKFGSNRKSGLQQVKQDQNAEKEDQARGIVEERAQTSTEEELPRLSKVTEVDENEEKASSSTNKLNAAEFSKPVRDKTLEKLFHEDIRLDQESGSQPALGTTSEENTNCFNVVMIGESSVGKTSFMKRALSGKFSLDLPASVGLDSCKWTVVVDGKRVVLQLWDTAGQERFHSITRQVFHKAQAFLLMYDITSSHSFSAVSYWANSIQEAASEDVTVLLLGNKSDQALRQVKTAQGDILAKEYNFEFMECSAATGENVIEALEIVARMLSQRADLLREEVTVLHKEPTQRQRSKCC